MPELTIPHKSDLGNLLLDLDGVVFGGQLVPLADSPHVQALVREIGAGTPVRIDKRDDHLGLYGWAADGVRARIEADGGAIRFGWRFRDWPGVLLTAEYHAVWEQPDGALVDITPAITEDSESLFAPDDTEPPPGDRYHVQHVSPDRFHDIVNRIASLKPGQRAYEERRAAKAGQSLHDWIGMKSFPDILIDAIPAFIAACDDFTAKRTGLPELIELRPDNFNEAEEGEWHLDWETELAREKIFDWVIVRERRMADIEEGMEAMGLTDTRFPDLSFPET